MSKEEIFAIIDDELEKRKLNTFLLWDFPNAVKKRIEELYQSVDNANPSEALEKLLDGYSNEIAGRSYYDTIKQALIKAQEQEKVLNELIKLVKDLEPTFNRKGVSSDTDILGTIIKDYFYDNASELLKSVFEKNIQK